MDNGVMIEAIEHLSSEDYIVATVRVVKINEDYASHLEIGLPETGDPNILREMLNQLSEAFADCKFRLDRVIEQI